MAIRPIFLPCGKDKPLLFEEVDIEFKWNPGMSITQKKKNMTALHNAANEKGIKRILEISTKSDSEEGRRLSAFNLKLKIQNFKELTVESAFQGSKVFEYGGPFVEFYNLRGKEIKKSNKLKNYGKLIGFNFNNINWDLEPKTAFYDWLYINALNQNHALYLYLLSFDAFTDIEFNPKKSFNCQARSAAVFVSLFKKELLIDALKCKEKFIELLRKNSNDEPKQLSF
jgi:hypothetical protein